MAKVKELPDPDKFVSPKAMLQEKLEEEHSKVEEVRAEAEAVIAEAEELEPKEQSLKDRVTAIERWIFEQESKKDA